MTRAGALLCDRCGPVSGGIKVASGLHMGHGLVQEAAWLLMHLEQLADLAMQVLVACAGLLQEGFPLVRRDVDGGDKHVPDSLRFGVHGSVPLHWSSTFHAISAENSSTGKGKKTSVTCRAPRRVQAAAQPGPGVGPVLVGRGLAQADHLGRLLD